VLQEVAAARHILIMCGSTVIDGYAFCSGVDFFYKAHRNLEISIPSATYLIRGAIFRPKRAISWSGRASLDIRPLGELIDMFHTHEATKRVDKVYALLGMSSDNPSTAGLLPDYEIPWAKLFRDLVKFLLYTQVYVKTSDDEEKAIIKGRGCILGKVLSIESEERQKVNITFKNMPEHLGSKKKSHALWTLQASAKHIREGDIVCLLQGTSKPMIIRPCKDHFTIIRIAAFPEGKRTESGDVEWPKLLQSITIFPHEFLLVWSWENSLKLQDPGEYEVLVRTNSWASEQSEVELGGLLDKANRFWNVAIILDDLEEYEKAEERLREAIEGYEIVFRKEHLYTPKSQYGRTPLSWAAWGGHESVVQLLLAKDGIDPDLKDSKSGQTPLSWAAEGGHEAVVQLLLATGKVDVDSKDKDGRTPLSRAACRGHEAVVQLLLATGKVDVDSKDKDGRKPLLWAAYRGQEAVVQLLLATGKVDVDSKDNYGQTPLLWAARAGHKSVVRLLLTKDGIDVDSKDKYGQTPLLWAAYGGHEAVVRLLLTMGKVNVDSKDKYSRTPLLWAAHGGHVAVVQLLLATGKVDVDLKDEYNRTPLLWAAHGGHETVVQLLLATGKVDVDSKDEYGQTPLLRAARGGQEAVVQLLLATGRVDVDSKDKYGRTPLWWARVYNHKKVIQLLTPIT
jgi:ankyrin repeat protein